MNKAAVEQLAASVEDLRTQVAALTARLAKLEGAGVEAAGGVTAVSAAPPAVAEAPVAPAAPSPRVEIAPEILLAISAAVAAYLGERAHVRAVRLVSNTRWSQEGRVSIQASHRLQRG